MQDLPLANAVAFSPNETGLVGVDLFHKLVVGDGGSVDACSEQSYEEIFFHASSIEPVVELCDVALEVLLSRSKRMSGSEFSSS